MDDGMGDVMEDGGEEMDQMGMDDETGQSPGQQIVNLNTQQM